MVGLCPHASGRPSNRYTRAWAWGRLGHWVISRIAEKQLTPAAKAAIAELLEPGESLADASLWADVNRGRLPKTAPWHYVDVPLDEPRYDSTNARTCIAWCPDWRIPPHRRLSREQFRRKSSHDAAPVRERPTAGRSYRDCEFCDAGYAKTPLGPGAYAALVGEVVDFRAGASPGAQFVARTRF
jgi:hypothetical protein